MDRTFARDAIEIRNEIRKTEAALEEALLQSTKLMQRMIQGRQNPRLPVNAAQEAFVRLARAQQQVIDSSSDIFKAHAILGEVAREMGFIDDGNPTTDPKGLTDLPATMEAARLEYSGFRP